jgi:hypothetical protein
VRLPLSGAAIAREDVTHGFAIGALQSVDKIARRWTSGPEKRNRPFRRSRPAAFSGDALACNSWGDQSMRLLFGIIIGAVLTVGGAYVHDTKVSGPFAAQERLVNWDVAQSKARTAFDAARDQIRQWTGV